MTFGNDDYSRTTINSDYCSFVVDGSIDPMADCDDKTYYGVCFSFISFIALCACVCNDLSAIFGVIAACYGTLMDYIFPGLFFLSSLRYLDQNLCPRGSITFGFIAIGVAWTVFSNYFNIMKITN